MSWVQGEKGEILVWVEKELVRSKQFEIQLEILRPDRSVYKTLIPTAESNREYRAEWVPDAAGKFIVSAAIRDGNNTTREDCPIDVETYDAELDNPFPNHDLLKQISESTDGAFFEPNEFSPEMIYEKIKVRQSPMAQVPIQKDLWDSPWLLGCIAGLLLVEWGIRRYQGEP